MADKGQYRMERIERIMDELKYEVTRGMMEREIDERIGFEFTVPSQEKDVVVCRFQTEPVDRHTAAGTVNLQPRLKVVE